MAQLIHDLIYSSANRMPERTALSYKNKNVTYAELVKEIKVIAGGLLDIGLGRHERVAVYLEKRIETVSFSFAATLADGVFVPVNPLLKPEQVAYILADCNVRILLTSIERLKTLAAVLPICPDLHTVIVVDTMNELPNLSNLNILQWTKLYS